ncbi:MAG: DUF202 domain-containing protein [Lewinellaceae bacterium]|nr:DUF202 domain-containing protein [Phaeodactylibacter sp.]MCB9039872.1 DUF202 domain-containing protein [Lewinellaceae bacterium]
MAEEEDNKLITRDYLAIERTRLANERTFLAYFRTAVVFLSAGFAILQLDALQELHLLGWFLLFLSPVILLVGTFRLVYVRRKIRKYYSA